MKATMQFMDFNQEDNNNLKTRELKPMQMASTVPRIQKVGIVKKRELKRRNELRINERQCVFPS